jgi:hypothetical protein
MIQPPRRVSKDEDPLKALEDEAYAACEEAAEQEGSAHGKYRHYAHLGSEYAKPFRAEELGKWPLHTDFRPDNLKVGD